MRKFKKLIILFIITIVLCITTYKIVFSATTTDNATDWADLKEKIEGNTNIEITLSSNKMTADSVITIKSGQTVTIKSGIDVTVTRSNSFTSSMFEVIEGGKLSIQASNSKTITLDGKLTSSQATNSIIKVRKGNLTLNNVNIQNNSRGTGNGGGLSVDSTAENSVISISNSTFKNNQAEYGGGIYVRSETCKTTLNNSTISGNTAFTQSGGGIYAYGNLVINNTNITSNSAKSYGGGIMVKTTCTLNSGTISKNTVTNEDGQTDHYTGKGRRRH